MHTQMVSFTRTRLTTDMVLAEIPAEGRESYREIIDDILDRYQRHLRPQAMWRKVNVSWAGDCSVRLGGTIMQDIYLSRRLDRVNTAYVFLAKINDDLWKDRKKSRDMIENYLFTYIMKASINHAFSTVASEIVSMLPAYSKLYMDNPGFNNGWSLSHQEGLLHLLQEDCPPMVHDIKLTPNGFFINEYSLMGIIYARSREKQTALVLPENDLYPYTDRSRPRHTMTPQELMDVLYTSAGFC